MDVNLSFNLGDAHGTCIQSIPDGRTWEWEAQSLEHVLLSPRRKSEPDSEHITNPLREWDGTTFRFKEIPRNQVGEQTDPRNSEEVSEYSSSLYLFVTVLHYDDDITTNSVLIVM